MDDDMRDHYDFRGGVRGKYARRYAEGTNVVVLDPDVAKMFPDREVRQRGASCCRSDRADEGAPKDQVEQGCSNRPRPRRSSGEARSVAFPPRRVGAGRWASKNLGDFAPEFDPG